MAYVDIDVSLTHVLLAINMRPRPGMPFVGRRTPAAKVHVLVFDRPSFGGEAAEYPLINWSATYPVIGESTVFSI